MTNKELLDQLTIMSHHYGLEVIYSPNEECYKVYNRMPLELRRKPVQKSLEVGS